MNLRMQREALEEQILSPHATRSAASKGRQRPEREDPLRPAFQHDRDRILYCKAFRRLKHKTQVFLAPTGDHYRTRLTHTLEVSQIARTMARALRLNEDLTEAIAMGHDLGHTPFGHAGESVLNDVLPGGFKHHQQSLRVVELLEKNGKGLNLTFEVRQGIAGHSKGKGPFLPKRGEKTKLTLEGQLVRAADVMAYIAHDTEDAIRGGVLKRSQLPKPVVKVLGSTLSRQINTMVSDLITQSAAAGGGALRMRPEVEAAMKELRAFLYKRVYENMEVHEDFLKASKVVTELFEMLCDPKYNHTYREYLGGQPPTDLAERRRAAADYIAGMTDRYALNMYHSVFLPHPWGRM
ncbi:MAG: deoxyguanosinetriphosphate triphosphohydrolase [Proteobacteria bacterium]|nr:deoxyguanosinetriphosphate triphosphohydrolase [Pseudomonadota bacterium]MBU4276049.1 deoxyguanosinetriphosphate triphosphohydrolase [Pseudomonadota bacterium]MBU4384084.1 deoxyguanosinetriphosphate triphosphohydrolase [Pseudomonadota bacterium]MBU4604374.1 deoxyguanosinetriphosphate triphosphohydrolase [Pseudomonadota bacterium]MCG2763723.1 deoxyguanosinetriphosphate triphosphohydrolase [Desulfarculaceae bacterium]